MAKEPTSMIGHMFVAAQKTTRIMLAPVAFVGRAAGQALERLIPQGATEITNALWTGNAYAPPVLHTPDQGNVHGTAPAQQQAATQVEPPQPQQQATGWGQQVPMGHREIGYSANHKIIDMQPQIAPPDYTPRIEAAAARGAGRSADQGMER